MLIRQPRSNTAVKRTATNTEKFNTFAPVPVGNIVVIASSGTFRFEAVNEADAQQDLAETERLEIEPTSK